MPPLVLFPASVVFQGGSARHLCWGMTLCGRLGDCRPCPDRRRLRAMDGV